MKFVTADTATEETVDSALDEAFKAVVSEEVQGAIFGKKYVRIVIDAVCDARRVARADVLGRLRNRNIVWPRQEAQYILHKTTSKSFPQIAKEFDRDHTSVIHSVRSVERRMHDAEYRAEVSGIMAEAWKRYEKNNPQPR